MKNRTLLLAGAAIVLLAAIVAFAVTRSKGEYNETVTRKVDEALGPDYRAYQAVSYPTNNFGIATAYTAEGAGSKVRAGNFLCDTWECLGRANAVPTDAARLLDVDTFAAVGGDGPAITLTENEKQSVGLKVLLPKIYQVMDVGTGVQKDRTTVVNLDIGKAYPRLLRRTRILPYIRSLSPDHLVRQAFDSGQLVLIVGDVVVDAMKVTVEVDQAAKGELDAKLAGGASKVFSDASLSVAVKKEVDGKYTFEVSRPVIIKTLGKRQPREGALGASASDSWDDWGAVEISTDSIVS